MSGRAPKKRGNIFRWPDLVYLAVGVWLGFSPWLLGFFDDIPAATGNALASGAVVIVLATFDLESPGPWEQWLLAVVGIWLVASPLLLGYLQERVASGATIVTGISVVALAGSALLALRSARSRRRRE